MPVGDELLVRRAHRPDTGLFVAAGGQLNIRIKFILHIVHVERTSFSARALKSDSRDQRAVYFWTAFLNLVVRTS